MVPVAYSCRNLLVRWKTTLMTAGGFMLVVAAMVVMLAFVHGLQTVCVTSGELENVVVLDDGTTDEVFSRLDADIIARAEHFPDVLRDAAGRLLASRELFMVVSQPTGKPGEYQLLQARGVLPEAWSVHARVRLAEGRMNRPGQDEVVVGRAVVREHSAVLGSAFRLGRKDWRVVGVFDAEGSSFESEIWCDLHDLAGHFRRSPSYTSVVLRTADSNAARKLAQSLTGGRSIAVEAVTERGYYELQSRQTQMMLKAGLVIAAFMGLGAVFSIMNTMFAAISLRTKDIAILRILGFTRRQIMLSFLFEALVIASLGGICGALAGYATNGLTRSTAIGTRSIEFAFQVDAPILLSAACFTLVMGFLGGLLPAMAAMRVEPLSSLR